MKFISYILIFIMSTGCTSMKPVRMTSGQLQDATYLENSVKKGDDIKVIMKDGTKHEFTVIELTDQLIIGKNISVPIHDISTLEIETVSIGKTSIVTVVILGILVLIGLASGGAGIYTTAP